MRKGGHRDHTRGERQEEITGAQEEGERKGGGHGDDMRKTWRRYKEEKERTWQEKEKAHGSHRDHTRKAKGSQ